MNTKIKLILLVVLTITFSCSDYLDINDNPNAPSSDDVTPDLILSGAMTDTYRTQARTMNILGNTMMNNWGANVNSFTGGFSEEFSLAIDNNFYSGIFTSLFRNTANFEAIINHPDNAYSNHKAIAKIMKTFYFQYLVDLYGDIPYSQAHKGIDNLTPAYDDDKEIYRALVTQLDEAIAMIGNADATTLDVGAEDVIFGGSMSSWVSFANTVKLRILMRESTKARNGDTESQTYLNQQFATLQTAVFINDDVTINPGYSNESVAQQNPFYALFFSNNETTSVNYNFYRASQYAVNFLINSADSRINFLYDEADDGSGGIVGHEQGADGDNSPAGLSPIGPGLVIDSGQDGYIMTGAESLLLQAEAQLYSYIPGNPQASFEAAIDASFALLGADRSTYNPTTVGLGWAGSDEDKLEAIMRQKWIATNGINAIESYIEFTRTGYPNDIPLALTAQSSTRPKRLMYPSSELVSNSANVPQQSSADVFATGPFWAQ
ncbi:SusD/RagB family nutrient-binding outer membrane lipoprotein [Corallibacter vietnamensis]|uniref:SusD/RagB family nutrient-binding outer membrane lipoprotein n=1 Tax=Corallibacter vietnamensis TaxID=904130 RepID=A0ABP7GTR6_9FLAO